MAQVDGERASLRKEFQILTAWDTNDRLKSGRLKIRATDNCSRDHISGHRRGDFGGPQPVGYTHGTSPEQLAVRWSLPHVHMAHITSRVLRGK